MSLRVAVFPAVSAPRAGAAPEPLAADSEASCFYHPESRAAIPCDQCGRFLCRLCDIDVDGRHLCPSCFQMGMDSRNIETVDTRRVMHDTVALAFATFPLLLVWPAIFGAPAALWTVIRHWRSPSSIVPRTRIRFYLAAVLALAEIAGLAALIWALVHVPRTR